MVASSIPKNLSLSRRGAVPAQPSYDLVHRLPLACPSLITGKKMLTLSKKDLTEERLFYKITL